MDNKRSGLPDFNFRAFLNFIRRDPRDLCPEVAS
jgi:hypothetical protein